MQETGENKSKLQYNTEKIAQFVEKILPSNAPPGLMEEYDQYMRMGVTDLKALNAEECVIISTRLAQYSLYLQRTVNQHESAIKYIRHEINNAICTTAHQYNGQWDLQRTQAIQDNLYAKSCQDKLVELEQRIESLSEVVKNIQQISDKYKSLQFSKNKAQKYV